MRNTLALMSAERIFLIDPDTTSAWLSTLPHDSLEAAGALAEELHRVSLRIEHFDERCLASVLLADEWALPIWTDLLARYATEADDPEQAQPVLRRLGYLNEGFGAFYDALIEALRRTPRRSREHAYAALVRRLAHYREEAMLHVLRNADALRWERVHRLYAFAEQQAPTYTTTPAEHQSNPSLATSAESEYIQTLLLHQLHNGRLGAFDVVRAAGWLGRWVVGMAITRAPVSGHAFALYTRGRAGLIVPPKSLSAGLLWLDVGPLHARIRQAIHDEHERPVRESSSFPTTQVQHITVLDRLLEIWQGPAPELVRREVRRTLRRPVSVAFEFAGIVPAVRHFDTLREAVEPERDVTIGPDTIREGWMVSDVSDSGCRLQGQMSPDVRIGPGTLVMVRLSASRTRIIGIVRREVRARDAEVELGVQILATNLRPLELREAEAVEPVLPDVAANDGPPAAGGPRSPALFLGPGAGRYGTIRESMILRPVDYALGRIHACETTRSSYRIALGQAIESTSDYVWAVVSVTKVASRTVRPAA